jgi:hypothetical protein
VRARPARRRARLRFRGALDPAAFAAFAARRAALLRLDAIWGPARADLFECEIAGAPEMVDAFEMACWLGPPHAMIAAVERETTGEDA